jgi:hypothetical protein
MISSSSLSSSDEKSEKSDPEHSEQADPRPAFTLPPTVASHAKRFIKVNQYHLYPQLHELQSGTRIQEVVEIVQTEEGLVVLALVHRSRRFRAGEFRVECCHWQVVKDDAKHLVPEATFKVSETLSCFSGSGLVIFAKGLDDITEDWMKLSRGETIDAL